MIYLFKVILFDSMTSFDHYIGENTEAIYDRIWVIVPRFDHTLSLNNMIASTQNGTDKKN